jgi:hypothetical protein
MSSADMSVYGNRLLPSATASATRLLLYVKRCMYLLLFARLTGL